MGMVISPYRFGASLVPFSVGRTSGAITSASLSANFMIGSVFSVPFNGVLDTLNITNQPTAGSGNFRLCIYAATSSSVWGAKLAETASQAALAGNETRAIPLLVPLTVTAGQLIALSLHSGGTSRFLAGAGGGSRYWASDTYGDGAANPAPATLDNGTTQSVIWASGLR